MSRPQPLPLLERLRCFAEAVATGDEVAVRAARAAADFSEQEAPLADAIEALAISRARAAAESAMALAERATLRTLSDMAPAIISLTVGPEHEFAYVNEQFTTLTGPRVLLGRKAAECLPDVASQGFLVLADMVFSTGTPVSAAEQRVDIDRLGDGVLVEGWFNFLLAPWKDAAGNVTGVWLHGVEVTDQVRARRDAETARANMQSLIMQAPAMIAIRRGPEHIFEMANEAYSETLGGRNLLGRAARDVAPDIARAGLYEILDGVFSTGIPHIGREMRVVHEGREGPKEGWYNLVYQPLRDNAGVITGTMLHAVEITEQVRARHEAEAARSRFRDLVQSIDAIVWESPAFGTEFTFVSDRAETLLGYPVARWLERDFWRSILHPEDRSRVVDISERGVAAGHGHEMEYRVLAADGRVVWLQDVTRVVRDGDGVPLALRGVMLDITARKLAEVESARMQTQLLQVQKLESLGVLAGGIAHDFNNLLTVILGNASLASLRLPDNSPVRGAIDDLVATAQRAADLTRQLLAYSGRAPFKAESLDLSAQVKEIVGLLEATLPKKVQLRLDLATGLPAVQADPAQLQQVVMNLVMNASEAIHGATGCVSVASRVERINEGEGPTLVGVEGVAAGQYVVLEVKDDGMGMDPVTLGRVFDPFFTTKSQGRGLGLAAVLGIVRGHKGGIRIESEEGGGTRFSVYLPATTRVAPPPPNRAGALPRGRGLVLLVDDEVEVRATARAMLEHLGYSVTEASDGGAGVAVFRAKQAEIVAVLLDWTMPIMDGEEVFRVLRDLSPTLPVILSSGYTEYDARRRGMPEGLSGFLQKPYTIRQLADAMAAAMVGGTA